MRSHAQANPWKRLGLLLVLIPLGPAAFVFWSQSVDLAHLAGAGEEYGACITRDTR